MVDYYTGKNMFINHVEDFEYFCLPKSSLINNVILKIEDFYKWTKAIAGLPNKCFEIVYDFESPYVQFLGFLPSNYYKIDDRFEKIAERYQGCQRSKDNYMKFQNEMIDNGYEIQANIDMTFIKIIDVIYTSTSTRN